MRLATLFLAFFLAIIRECSAHKVTVPGPFTLSISIPAKSVKIIRRWISKGGKTRLNITPTFNASLGLPPEAAKCGRKMATNTNTTSTSYSSSSYPGVDYAQLMFDWCRWEWNIKGKKS